VAALEKQVANTGEVEKAVINTGEVGKVAEVAC